jgi:hypothetical protein
MLVTFKTKAHANITMFGNVAVELLKLAGHSGTVPSAIRAEDVPAFLDRLQTALAARQALPADDAVVAEEDSDAEPMVPLGRRALPLLALLRDADLAGEDVLIATN